MDEEKDSRVEEPTERGAVFFSRSHDKSSRQEIPAAGTSKPESGTGKFSTRLIQFENAELKAFPKGNDFIGVGGFGNVRKYHLEKIVAVKEFAVKGDDETIQKIWTMVEREANVLCRFHHENIVGILGVTQWPEGVGIVMEYVDGGNLKNLLSEDNHTELSWNTRLKIARGITSGLRYIHNCEEKKTFCHGDIKPENILLTQSLQVKLADFGSAAFYRATGASTTTVKNISSKQFTLIYVAPEFLVDNTQKKKPAMDMYSFGMVLYELISRRAPYSDTSMPQHLPSLIMGKIKPSMKLIDNAESQLETDDDRVAFNFLKKQMQSCWDKNPNLRPSSKAVEMELSNYLSNPSQGFKPRIDGSQNAGPEAAATEGEKASGPSMFHGNNTSVRDLLTKYTNSLLNKNFEQADSLKAKLRTLITDELRAEAEEVRVFGEKLDEEKNHLESIAIFDTAAALYAKMKNPGDKLQGLQYCIQGIKIANENLIEKDSNMKVIVRDHVIPLMRNWLHVMKNTSKVSEKWKCHTVSWVLYHIDLCLIKVDEHEEGKQALEDAVSEMRRVFGHDVYKQHGRLFGSIIHNLGVRIKRESRFDEAADLFKESIKAHREGLDYFNDEEDRKRDIEMSENSLKGISQEIWKKQLQMQ